MTKADPVYLIVELPNKHFVAHVRNTLHDSGVGSDFPLYINGNRYAGDPYGYNYKKVAEVFADMREYVKQARAMYAEFGYIGKHRL